MMQRQAMSPAWPWWLRLSVPIALLGGAAAAIGAFVDGAYHGMTENWANQTFAQDLADLFIAFPLLLITAVMASRGSTRAFIVWFGTLAAILYTYVIYAFAVVYGHMYLVNVVVLGMAGWVFAGATRHLDFAAIHDRYGSDAPVRSTGIALVTVAAMFLVMWLIEDVPATIRGEAPASLREIGLIVNPVHVLDTAFLLPACIVTGIALIRKHAFAYVLAPALLVTLVVLSAGIATILLVSVANGDTRAIPIATAIVVLGTLQAWFARRFLAHL